jgi:HK97 family phage major capsid protein
MNLESLRAQQSAIIARVKARGDTVLNDQEDLDFRALQADILDIERRAQDRSTADRIWQAANGNGTAYRHDAYTDRQNSYVRDLIGAVIPAVDSNGEGRQRLGGLETRDVSGLTSSTAFDPPQCLLELYARVSRPNAPLYSLLHKMKLDAPVVKTPKIVTGNTASAQSAENATISTTDWTDEYITVTPKTYAAASYVSDQALTLSPVALDSLIFVDLFAALAVEIETACLYDGAFGLDTLAVSSGTVFSTGSSDTADTLAAFARALNAIATTRYNTENVVAITHPGVILHQTSHVDTTRRPIYLGDHGFNPAGIPGPVDTLGQTVAPAVTIQGVPVYSDASISVSGGQAPIYFIKLDDSFVSEYGPSTPKNRSRLRPALDREPSTPPPPPEAGWAVPAVYAPAPKPASAAPPGKWTRLSVLKR